MAWHEVHEVKLKQVFEAPKRPDYKVRVSYNDPSGIGRASATHVVKSARDGAHAKELFTKEQGWKYKNKDVKVHSASRSTPGRAAYVKGKRVVSEAKKEGKARPAMKHKLPDHDEKLPDTGASAIKALGHLSVHDTKGATAHPGSGAGHWIVHHKAGKSSVYLRGHHRSLINSRFHDFEDHD
jgi:hypothetical protein